MTDPLASWWVHTLSVKRLSAVGGAGGDDLAAAVDVVGFYKDGQKLVTDSNGKQVLSTGQFAFPAGVDRIPVGSLVTVPAKFGGRESKVIASSLGDGGGQPTPDHHEIALI